MAVGNGFDVWDDEEEPQYPSDFEECLVDEDEDEDEDNNNNHNPHIYEPLVFSSEEEEPQYIDDYYIYDNLYNHEIMISTENVDEFEHQTAIDFGEVDSFQGFGAMSSEEEFEQDFVNGLVNVDDFEYEFEFVDDDNNEEMKGLNSVVRDFPDGFGQTGSVMYERRKVSAVRDFPDGFGSGVPTTDKRTVSLEEVQEKSVQETSVQETIVQEKSVQEPPVKKRKTTSDVGDFSDEQGRVTVLALQAPQFCPWRDKNGNLNKGRSHRGNLP